MMQNAEAFDNTHERDTSARSDGDRQTMEAVRATEQTQSARTLQRTIGNAQLCRILRMTEPSSGGQSHLPPSVTQAIQRGGGERLQDANRVYMESALGADLGGVRIHQDSDSAHAADDISARAFTIGQDVYFGAGQYEPGTERGNHLLAHELTHTLQQAGGSVMSQADTPMSRPADPVEGEAEAVADSIGSPRDPTRSSHQALRPQLATPPMVQGDWDEEGAEPEPADAGTGDQAGVGPVQDTDQAGAGPGQDTDQAGADSESAGSESVAGMGTISRLTEAVTDAGKYLPSELVDQLKELLSPKSLAIMAAFVVAQAFGAGEIADVAGLAMLAFKIGSDAVVVAKDLFDFFSLAVGAQTKNDLDQAGSHLAHAIMLAGVDVLLVFLAAKESSKDQGEDQGQGKDEDQGQGKDEDQGQGKDEDQGQGKDEVSDSTLENSTVDSQPEQAEEPSTPADPAALRVKLRISTKRAILDQAPNKLPDGDFYDPNTGEVIPKDGPFDFGHKPGFEWWRTQERARAEGWTRQQVIEYENDPSHYQIEEIGSNRGHFFEAP